MTQTNPIRDEVSRIAAYNAGLTVAEVTSRYAPEKISKLGSNENPYGPSPRVFEALAAAASSIHHYPDPAGRELRDRLAQRHEVAKNRIVLGNGSEDLLSVICKTVLRPGDRMLTLFPSFPLHEDYATVMGATIERVDLRDDLTIDVDGFTKAALKGPRLVMFSNPMNPAGTWLTRDELSKVIANTPEHTLLVIDEAYAEYAAGEDYAAAPELLAGRPNWIVLRTFSKAWGLAGLRVGYGIVGSSFLAAYIDRVRTPFNVNGPAQAAAVAALSDEPHMLNGVAATLQERERVRGVLGAEGFRVAGSKGNFLFIDVRRDAVSVSELLLEKGVIIKPWKQNGYKTFLRASIGTPEENDHLLRALAEIMRTE